MRWKVIPIYKKGGKFDCNNYRPISVLPLFSKVLERLVYNRLYNFFIMNNLLSPNQYGFRKNCSTEFALIELYDHILKCINTNKHAITIFMDLSKAFDTLSHSVLLSKLSFYGIRGLPHSWFCSYLRNRKQFTVYDGQSSNSKMISSGVPQGSILGPLLFVIYINDIVNCSDFFKFVLFADDTSLIVSDINFNSLVRKININLDYVYNWLVCNKLSLNILKTKFVIFRNKQNKRPDYSDVKLLLNGSELKQCSTFTYLGVQLDEFLTWDSHINVTCSKISKITGIMNNVKCILPPKLLFTMYNTFILPHVMYCNVVWASLHASKLSRIHRFQKRALQICANAHYLAPSLPLFRRFSTLNVYDSNKLSIDSFMHKFFTKRLPPYGGHQMIGHQRPSFCAQTEGLFLANSSFKSAPVMDGRIVHY